MSSSTAYCRRSHLTYSIALLFSIFITIAKADCDWYVFEDDLRYNGHKVKIDYSTRAELTPAWPNIWLAMDTKGNELHRMTLEQQTIAFSNGPNRQEVFVFDVDIKDVKRFYAIVAGSGSCKVKFDNAQMARPQKIEAYIVEY